MVKRHYGIRTDRYKLIHFYYDIDAWEQHLRDVGAEYAPRRTRPDLS
jgi:hypothetical protein